MTTEQEITGELFLENHSEELGLKKTDLKADNMFVLDMSFWETDHKGLYLTPYRMNCIKYEHEGENTQDVYRDIKCFTILYKSVGFSIVEVVTAESLLNEGKEFLEKKYKQFKKEEHEKSI